MMFMHSWNTTYRLALNCQGSSVVANKAPMETRFV